MTRRHGLIAGMARILGVVTSAARAAHASENGWKPAVGDLRRLGIGVEDFRTINRG
jgi:hypothetical protein